MGHVHIPITFSVAMLILFVVVYRIVFFSRAFLRPCLDVVKYNELLIETKIKTFLKNLVSFFYKLSVEYNFQKVGSKKKSW